MMKMDINMTLDEIHHLENISIRSVNVCEKYGLFNLEAILNFYKEHGSFESLRNCGKKSNQELIALSLKHINNIKRITDNSIETDQTVYIEFDSALNGMTRMQREIINSFIEININNLTIRSKNAIISFLGGDLKVKNVFEKILSKSFFDFHSIKNVGEKSVNELKEFIESLSSFMQRVSEVKTENELISIRNRFYIEKTFSIANIPSAIYDSLSIFKLVDFLLTQNAIFTPKEHVVFIEGFKIYEGQAEISLSEIADKIGMTKERVRQIRKSMLGDLLNIFKFIKNIDDDLYQKYNIDITQNFIFIDDHINEQINKTNLTRFTKEFNSFLIFVYLSDNFNLIGDIEDVLMHNYFFSRTGYNWKKFYLINKNFNSTFNIEKLIYDLDKRINNRIDESYSFNFKSYVQSFISSNNLNDLIKAFIISESILNNEFSVYLDTEENIHFLRNSLKQVYEYSHEALKLIGRPSKVAEITNKIKELYPEYDVSDSKVRASMRRGYGFVPIGRSSMFGLKEWEFEKENFKGGTIRGITIEFLQNQKTPKHISEVANYVVRYRPDTYERSILDNLRADKTGIFTFYKNSTIGLSYIRYDKSYIKLSSINRPKKRTWDQIYHVFKNFIDLNNRMPVSSGIAIDEINLYRWFKGQERRFKANKLDPEKSRMMTNLFKQVSIFSSKSNSNS